MSKSEAKYLAIRFVYWLDDNRWKIEYAEQREFAIDELYDVFYAEYLSR